MATPVLAATATARATRRRGGRRSLTPYLYIAPFFLVFGVFGAFPLAYTAFISLFDWNPIGDQVFIGFDNYVALVADPRFWNASWNTVVIWVLSTVPQLAVALVLAAVLNQALLKFRTGFRMAVLVPNITSVLAVGIIFTQLFGRDYGMINSVIEALGGDRIDWVAGTFSSQFAVSTMVMWRWTGYNALIYLAAMQSIPRALYESAEIDGAGAIRRFFTITIPQVRPTIIFTVIVSTIGGLQIFAEPLVFGGQAGVTGGQSRQFQTLALFLYEQGFRNLEFGYASAIAWALFLIIVVLTIINLALSSRIASEK
ncbi:sugar ABC transporter permease [Agromyces rhizosphaerae]|uniref:Sugar ABC transporter permease n=1 Tax=Agromyces rhizosphaerae TaxID=88374 RepID=A0A9W6CU91_9MICO|nr:sugar ABC transporter permease [Agromyces rhizosphaerae]GLI26929.1 sugar ABC transporter permease [Agromyces rhizosphaerae]